MNDSASRKSVTEQLVELFDRPISTEDRARTALHLIDWIGCAIIGRTTETGIKLETEAEGGPVPLFAGRFADPSNAAFVLGAFGSILEMDDVHRAALLHPGPIVIPAALAVARAETAGDDFLDAMIVGSEAMIRLGRSVGAGHYAFYHNTGTCGGIGAAAAAARLQRLDRAATVSALGNAISVAGGLWQCRHERVMTKPFHCAEASRRGVVAARLARHGVTGPRFILEGPQGFFMAACPGAEPSDVLRGADDGWLIHETSFKPWPACRHAHAAIDAALALRDRLDPASIEAIEIETYRDAQIFCDRPNPTTTNEAKFSLQHAVAIALVDGAPPLSAFDLPALDRPEIASLRQRATVKATEAFSRPYPAHFGSAVTLMLRDGTTRHQSVPDAWGDSENPLDEAALMAKFDALVAAAGLSPASRDRIKQSALELADGAPLGPLREALHAI